MLYCTALAAAVMLHCILHVYSSSTGRTLNKVRGIAVEIMEMELLWMLD